MSFNCLSLSLSLSLPLCLSLAIHEKVRRVGNHIPIPSFRSWVIVARFRRSPRKMSRHPFSLVTSIPSLFFSFDSPVSMECSRGGSFHPDWYPFLELHSIPIPSRVRWILNRHSFRVTLPPPRRRSHAKHLQLPVLMARSFSTIRGI